MIDDDASIYEPLRLIVADALGERAVVEQHLLGMPGLRAIAARKPHIVILDLGLPDVDGLSVLRLMKTDATLKDVPVIVLTANSFWHSLTVALDAGADTYVFKPFDPRLLQDVLREVFRRRYPELIPPAGA